MSPILYRHNWVPWWKVHRWALAFTEIRRMDLRACSYRPVFSRLGGRQ